MEKKVRILHLVENEGLLAEQAAKRCGVPVSTGYRIVKYKDTVKTSVFECSRMMDGGLPYLMWPELLALTKNERETEADLRKRIKYLEAKVAYYEELSKLEGVDLGQSSKKNDAGRSKPSSKGESEP